MHMQFIWKIPLHLVGNMLQHVDLSKKSQNYPSILQSMGSQQISPTVKIDQRGLCDLVQPTTFLIFCLMTKTMVIWYMVHLDVCWIQCVCSCARDFPNAWPPLQHMIIEGLASTNSHQGKTLAVSIARRWLSSNYASFQAVGKMIEKYNAQYCGQEGFGGEYNPQVCKADSTSWWSIPSSHPS